MSVDVKHYRREPFRQAERLTILCHFRHAGRLDTAIAMDSE